MISFDTNIFYEFTILGDLEEKIKLIENDFSRFILTNRVLKEINEDLEKDKKDSKFEKYCKDRFDKKFSKVNLLFSFNENSCKKYKDMSFCELLNIDEKYKEHICEKIKNTKDINDLFGIFNEISTKEKTIYETNINKIKSFKQNLENKCLIQYNFSYNEVKNIVEEYDFRYKDNDIFWGKEDFKNKQNSQYYSDYIIFKELVCYASKNNKDIVFITEDLKDLKTNKKIDEDKINNIKNDFFVQSNRKIFFLDLENFYELLESKLIQKDIAIKEEIDKQIYTDNQLNFANVVNSNWSKLLFNSEKILEDTCNLSQRLNQITQTQYKLANCTRIFDGFK